MLTIVCYGDLWVNKASVNFRRQMDLRNKTKYRYNNADLALMG